MSDPAPLTTYLELRQSAPDGSEGSGLSHKADGLFLLHVVELAAHGEPRGAVTFVHDAGDHGERYLGAARTFAEDRWAVALPDMRGHGRSEGPRGHSAGVNEVVRDLQAVQDHVAYRLPDAPKFLIGQGLGALWALAYAVEKPGQTAGVVLLAPLWSPRFDVPQPAAGLKKLFKKVGPLSEGRLGARPEALFSDPAEAEAWRSDPLCHDTITVRAAEQAAHAAATYARRTAEARVPILALHGSADPLSPAQASRALEGVEVRVFEGARHDLLHEPGAAEVAACVRGWIGARI